MIVRGFQEFVFGPSLLAKVIQNNRRNDQPIRIDRIAYGEHPQQYMLFFHPHGKNRRNKLIFFIHGGAWRVGSPALFRFIGLFFARMGFAAVLPGYRLAPRFRFPAQLEDVGQALKVTIEWAETNGLTNDGIILGGYSAGAQLASLIAYGAFDGILGPAERGTIDGLLLVSGPLNFAACRRKITRLAIFDYLGSVFGWRKADPIRYVTGRETIPVLCIHGEDDLLVDIENSLTFTAKINAYCDNLAQLIPVKNACHADLLKIFWGELRETQQMVAWLDRIAPAVETSFEKPLVLAELEKGQNHQDQAGYHPQKIGIPTPMHQIANTTSQRGA